MIEKDKEIMKKYGFRIVDKNDIMERINGTLSGTLDKFYGKCCGEIDKFEFGFNLCCKKYKFNVMIFRGNIFNMKYIRVCEKLSQAEKYYLDLKKKYEYKPNWFERLFRLF